MSLPARPPRPPCLPPFSDVRGPSVPNAPGAWQSLGSVPEPRKTDPSEPIDANAPVFSEMCRILINRSHWSYVALNQHLIAKNGPISGNSVRPRTRIHSQEAGPGTAMADNEPGMSFGFRGKGPEGAFPRPELAPLAPRQQASSLAVLFRCRARRLGHRVQARVAPRRGSGAAKLESYLFSRDPAPRVPHAPGFVLRTSCGLQSFGRARSGRLKDRQSRAIAVPCAPRIILPSAAAGCLPAACGSRIHPGE